METHAFGQAGGGNVFLCLGQLAGQVNNGDFHIGIKAHTLHGPFAGIATDIQQFSDRPVKYQRQHFRERHVGIVVVKLEPAGLHLVRQLRQAFINGWPLPELLQASRFLFNNGFGQVCHAAVADIVDEVDIDAGQFVLEQEKAGLGQEIMIINQPHHLRAEAHFQQCLDTVQ